MLPGKRATRVEDIFFGYAESGSSRELGVNGSITPVRFEILFPDVVGRDFDIINTTLTFSGGKLDDPEDFIGLTALTNGLDIGFITELADFPLSTSPYKTNFDLVSGSGMSKPWGFDSVTNDMLYAEILGEYDIRMITGQVFGIYLIVNDNLSTLNGRFVLRGQTY